MCIHEKRWVDGWVVGQAQGVGGYALGASAQPAAGVGGYPKVTKTMSNHTYSVPGTTSVQYLATCQETETVAPGGDERKKSAVPEKACVTSACVWIFAHHALVSACVWIAIDRLLRCGGAFPIPTIAHAQQISLEVARRGG